MNTILVVILYIIFIVAGIKFLNSLIVFWCKSKVCLVGKTALITGGASGLGFQTALNLASRGCRIIIADIADTTQIVKDLIKQTHNPNIIGKKLDLGSLKSVREFAKNVLETESRLDILINNAGIGAFKRNFTEDGLESMMQINYFGHFLLTHLLLDLLKKSAPSRITFASSLAAYFSDLTVENLNVETDTHVLRKACTTGAYGHSKLCMALAAKMFAEKLKGTGVTTYTYHPGNCQTGIFYNSFSGLQDIVPVLFGLFVQLTGKSSEAGAQTIIHLAISDEVKDVSGKFFMEGKQVFFPFKLNNEEFCKQIWKASLEYTKIQPNETDYY